MVPKCFFRRAEFADEWFGRSGSLRKENWHQKVLKAKTLQCHFSFITRCLGLGFGWQTGRQLGFVRRQRVSLKNWSPVVVGSGKGEEKKEREKGKKKNEKEEGRESRATREKK